MMDEESDDISITSTVESEPRSEYVVDRILAERVGEDGQCQYLVKWEGYPDERSTWEPEDCFQKKTIRDWKKQSENSLFGEAEEAEEVNRKVQEYWARKADRQTRRERKRTRLTNPYEVSTDEDDIPLSQLRPKRKIKNRPSSPKPLKSTSTPASISSRKDQANKTQPVGQDSTMSTQDQSRGMSKNAKLQKKRVLPTKLAESSSAAQKSTTTPSLTGWIQGFRVTDSGNIRAKRQSVGHRPDMELRRTQKVPDKEALNLRPADEWTQSSDLRNYPISFSSNSDATRMTQLPPRIEFEKQQVSTPTQEPDDDQVSQDTQSPRSPLNRATVDHQPEPKRPRDVDFERKDETPVLQKAIGDLFWYKGEILAHLIYVDGRFIGPVRLQGFGNIGWLFDAIVHSKPQDSHRLEIAFKHAIHIERFRESCRGVSVYRSHYYPKTTSL